MRTRWRAGGRVTSLGIIIITCLAQVFKEKKLLDAGKEDSLTVVWLMRLCVMRLWERSVREYPDAHLLYLGQPSLLGEL